MLGSGTGEIWRFKSPVVVPAEVRNTAVPIVNEYGLAVGVNAAELLPAKVAPVIGPMAEPIRFAPENESAVLFEPPHARPVTLSLLPELVPPTVSNDDLAIHERER